MWTSRSDTRIYNSNRFKLGLFGMNCSGGLSLTKAPERWDASWDNNMRAAQLADEAGLEFLLPIGRWHGYQGESDTQGTTFETLTWACGLLALTNEITTFGTLHVAFVNPVFAAKQIVTADHIGHGRFGLNVVSGWNPVEFGMMGVDLKDHDKRYAYSGEWLDIVKKIWAEEQPFDYNGAVFQLKDVLSKPKPWWGTRPILVSAGNSDVGRAFAAFNADCLFTTIPDLETLAAKLEVFRSTAPPGQLRHIFSSCHLMVRPTRREAEEYHHYIVHEQGDMEAAEYALNLRGDRLAPHLSASRDKLRARLISGAGFPIVCSYDDAVAMFEKLSAAGLDGLACGMINYIDDFRHIRDGLLPRMERAGLREARIEGDTRA
ncbi:MAG: LLM class flavin-dependent oxidoreductase [Beijerinckiaceae bacterium]|nr:LLM class flavin-dependent oxidoreductase [Beijerinckiaceae bacterium]